MATKNTHSWIRVVGRIVDADQTATVGDVVDVLRDQLDAEGVYAKSVRNRDAQLEDRAFHLVILWLKKNGVDEGAIIGHQGPITDLMAVDETDSGLTGFHREVLDAVERGEITAGDAARLMS